MIKVEHKNYNKEFHKIHYDLMNGGADFFEFRMVDGTAIFCDSEDVETVNPQYWEFDIEGEVEQIISHSNEEDQYKRETLWSKDGNIWFLNAYRVCRGMRKFEDDYGYCDMGELISSSPIKKVYDWKIPKHELKAKVFSEEIKTLESVLDELYEFDPNYCSTNGGYCLRIGMTKDRMGSLEY
jgi:hypothetical protein